MRDTSLVLTGHLSLPKESKAKTLLSFQETLAEASWSCSSASVLLRPSLFTLSRLRQAQNALKHLRTARQHLSKFPTIQSISAHEAAFAHRMNHLMHARVAALSVMAHREEDRCAEVLHFWNTRLLHTTAWVTTLLYIPLHFLYSLGRSVTRWLNHPLVRFE